MPADKLRMSFWHPMTQFRVHVVKRTVVRTDVLPVDPAPPPAPPDPANAARADGGAVTRGSRLKLVTDVDLAVEVVPDRAARQHVSFDVGRLEDLELEFTIDDRGMLEAVNSVSGRDITPVLSVIGKVVSLVGVLAAAPDQEPPTLEEQWAREHAELAALGKALDERVTGLLGQLTAPATEPDDVVSVGRALGILESYQASIGQVRREWIASRAGVVEEGDWRLRTEDLLFVGGRTLPETIQEEPAWPAQQGLRAEGVVVAFTDKDRPSQFNHDSSTDTVVVRESRPAQVGVYLRGADGSWSLQAETVIDIDLVDKFSAEQVISLDGRWARSDKFSLAYHQDKSLKTFGISSKSSASSVATGIGGIVDSVSASAKAWQERPSETARRLERLKTQLDLAKTASELEVLAATRARAAEVAVLEQEKKIRDSLT